MVISVFDEDQQIDQASANADYCYCGCWCSGSCGGTDNDCDRGTDATWAT